MNIDLRLDALLSEKDREVFAASGYGRDGGFGARPAIIVIDVNHSFVGHTRQAVLESQRFWPNSCGEYAWDALPHIRRLIDTAHQQRIPVIHITGQDRRPDSFDAGRWRAKNARLDSTGSSGAKEGVDGFPRNNIVEPIAPEARDVVIRKLKPSAFFSTALLGYLIDLKIDTILLAGVATSGCVRATAVDGFSYNFAVGVVADACFDRIQASHQMALFDLQSTYADVLRTADAVSYLQTIEPGLFDDKIDFVSPDAARKVDY